MFGPWAYRRIMQQFALVHAKLDLILTTEVRMSKELDALQTAVENEDTVIDSAITLLNGLSAAIVAAKDDPVKLQALADDVRNKSQQLSDAVVANTPAA